MKKSIILFAVIVATVYAAGQSVNLLTLDQLKQRVAGGGDTTYVINFWATWCVPCMKELPNFEKFQEQHMEAPVKVLLVNVDFKSRLNSAVIPFVKKKGLKTEVFLFDEPDQQKYIEEVDKTWSGAIPATLFINKTRRQFFEKEFSYEELVSVYKKLNNPL